MPLSRGLPAFEDTDVDLMGRVGTSPMQTFKHLGTQLFRSTVHGESNMLLPGAIAIGITLACVSIARDLGICKILCVSSLSPLGGFPGNSQS